MGVANSVSELRSAATNFTHLSHLFYLRQFTTALDSGGIIGVKEVDHHYIDEHSLAEGYLDHLLQAEERREFEAHLVTCEECRDRLLLAEMFHARNGVPKPIQLLEAAPAPAVTVTKLKPWGVLLFFAAAAVAAVLLLLASAGLFHWFKLG